MIEVTTLLNSCRKSALEEISHYLLGAASITSSLDIGHRDDSVKLKWVLKSGVQCQDLTPKKKVMAVRGCGHIVVEMFVNTFANKRLGVTSIVYAICVSLGSSQRRGLSQLQLQRIQTHLVYLPTMPRLAVLLQ